MLVVVNVKITMDTAHNDPVKAVDDAISAVAQIIPPDGMKHIVTSVSPVVRSFGKIKE